MNDGFPIPGSDLEARSTYDDDGALTRLAVGGRVHVQRTGDGAWRLGDGLAVVSELGLPGGFLRRVAAGARSWTERYGWDGQGRPTEIDGVRIARDEHGRVVACHGPEGRWSYDYGPRGLQAVRSPRGERRIARDGGGRPVRVREPGGASVAVAYDGGGRRAGAGEDPAGWARDALGRLWTVRGPDGAIRATYLWSGMSCLGRIDGPPDDPLAAVFLLDPTGTPVRVVTRGGVLRIPRDAFGEALLEHPGVPGLFGGPVDDGLVRLPLRVLDPRLGAFDRPDPLDGLDADPRRAGGFAGRLPVDRVTSGAYAVCRDDPVGRADPSGGISALAVPVVLSSLTWSSQYNIVNINFLQLFVNLLPSLVTTDSDGRWSMRRFFDIEGLASRHSGGFGLRFNPVGIERWVKLFAGEARRFTLHHVFWCPSDDEAFGGLERIRLFEPAANFVPTCYGTLLRAEPSRARRFVLKGAANTGVTGHFFPPPVGENWTREGGAAAPVVPGSRAPRFPRGGLHFAPRVEAENLKADPGAVGRQDGRVAELAPDGTLAQGTVAAEARLKLPATGLHLAAAQALVVRHGADRELHEVVAAAERDDATSVRLARPITLPAGDLAVRGATIDTTTDTLAAGAQPDRLDARAPASTTRWAKGDLLRLTAAAGTPTAGEVKALEVHLTLAAAAPDVATLRLPWDLSIAVAAGTARPVTKATETELEFPGGQTPPSAGDALLIEGGGAKEAVVLTGAPADRRRAFAPALPATLTDPLTWRPLARSRKLGRASAAPAAPGTALVYAADTSGTAPAAGDLLLFEAGSHVAAGTVASVEADDIVLATALTGVAAGTALTAAKVTLGDPNVSHATFDTVQAITLAPAQDRKGRTLVLHQLTTPAVAAGGTELVHEAARSGDGVGFALPVAGGELPLGEVLTEGPTLGQLVLLTPDSGPGPLPAVVKAVRLTLTLDRRLAFPAALTAAGPPLATGLEVAVLTPAGPAYLADQLGPRRLLLRPAIVRGGRTERVEFPRPQAGDLVEVTWTGAPGPRLHRLTAVEGAAVTLDREGGALPINTPGLTVQLVDAADPGTGTSRIARNGTLSALSAADSTIAVDVWQPDALPVGARIAVTDGTLTFPSRVSARTRLEIAWHPGPALTAAATKVSIAAPALAQAPIAIASTGQEGADVVLETPAGARALTAGPNLVIAVEYPTEVTVAAGAFDPGSVRIPVEPTFELSRREALVDHEMTHTEQSALWGPILLSPVPFRGIEEIYEAAAGEAYPDALRQIGKLYSVGGLMNFVTSTVVSALAWVVFKLVSFLVRLFSGQPLSAGWLGHADWLPFHPATIPDAARPTRIQLATAGQPQLSVGDLVEVTAGETYRRATVKAIEGTAVDLDDPAPAGSDLRVALVADNDDTSSVEHAVMRHTGFGALEVPFDVYFDPWSQISNRGSLTPGSFEDILFRCARDLFGSSSWTLFPFSYFFFDNALRNGKGKGHLSKMEQSASQQSGELYSALAKLHGDFEVVGDVARYWHFIENRHGTLVADGGGDGLGPRVLDLVRVMPSARDNAGASSAPPNELLDTAPDAERPGGQVADAFTAKNLSDPLAAGTPEGHDPRGFAPSARGLVPVGPRNERCVGAYVAFTRPAAGGHHRVSSRNDFPGAPDSLEAQKEGKQTILFDPAVADVEVKAGDRVLAEGDRLTLVRGQTVALTVTPGGARRYAASVLQPLSGAVLRADGGLRLTAQGTNGVEPVEIARKYTYNATTGHYDHPALDTHGVHLPADVHVPVRRLEVEVVDTLAVLGAPDPRTAPATAPIHPGGSVYVVVPVAVQRPLQPGAVSYTVPTPAPAPVRDPAPVVAAEKPSAVVAPLLPQGTIYKVTANVSDPPEGPALIELTVIAALTDGTAELSALLALDPWFTLDAAVFTVARGARLTLTCSGGVVPGAITVTPAAGVTATIAGSAVQLDVAAGAALGTRTVLVTDSAAGTHKARRSFTVTT